MNYQLTTIVFRFLPGQLASILGDVGDLERTTRLAGRGQYGDLHLGLVLAVFVGGEDTVRARHGSDRLFDVQLGVVVYVDYVARNLLKGFLVRNRYN